MPPHVAQQATRIGDVAIGISISEEQALVARAKAGDQPAFEALVRHNAPPLYAVVLRSADNEAAARDATHRTFVRTQRNLSQFGGQSRLFPWLHRIAVKEAKNITKRRPGHGPAAGAGAQAIDDDPARGPEPQAPADQAQLCEALEQAMRRLPEKCRSAVVLHDVEGMSTAQAADALGVGETAFRRRLGHGRRALQRDVGDFAFSDGADGGRR